jgi:uridine kinase
VTDALSRRIAEAVANLGAGARPLIAFDGPDAAGKTWLADRVAEYVSGPTCRASIDGFHAPAATRRRRGSLSPDSYYRDSFDYDALTERLLRPFAEGAREVHTSVFDHRTDQPRRGTARVEPEAALLFDGVFLLRPELKDRWSLRIYLRVSDEHVLARARRRDAELFGGDAAVVERYRRRYLPGQALYRREARPEQAAHVVVDNDDFDAPVIVKWDVPAAG